MFKTIFYKQLAVYLVSATITFIALAFGLTYTFQNFFISQTTETLLRQGSQIAASYARLDGLQGGMHRGQGMGMMMQRNQAMQQLENDMRTMYTLGVSAFFIGFNQFGSIEITMATPDVGQVILDEEMARVFTSEIVVHQVPAGDLFDVDMLTVGYPIVADNQLIGAVFMSTAMEEVGTTAAEAIRLILLALMLSTAIYFILLFMMSRKVSKSLNNIGAAAKEIAGGGFGKRLEVGTKDEIGQLAESFNHMAQSLDNTERIRRQFIANISHDLRSPLTSMQGFLKAMSDGTISGTNRDKYLKIVLTETERLSDMVGAILELDKIHLQDGGLQIEEFDVNELLRCIIVMFETRITDKNLSVSIDFEEESSVVRADKEKISRVIHNLLDNSVKFTDNGGNIGINTVKQEGKILINISDSGIGMNEEQMRQIFDRFYKADTSRGESAGSGLGLSIVREFVAMHGEKIGLTSLLGEGSTFSFALPRVQVNLAAKNQ